MDEYIEKRKVVNLLIELENEFQQFKPFKGFEHAMYRKLCEAEIAIEKLPAADVVPVVHARWIYVEETLATSNGYCCSACRRPRWLSPDVPEVFKYCPKCGAKMDGERKDGGDG